MAKRVAMELRESETVGIGDLVFVWWWWKIGGGGTFWEISRLFGALVGFWDEAK